MQQVQQRAVTSASSLRLQTYVQATFYSIVSNLHCSSRALSCLDQGLPKDFTPAWLAGRTSRSSVNMQSGIQPMLIWFDKVVSNIKCNNISIFKIYQISNIISNILVWYSHIVIYQTSIFEIICDIWCILNIDILLPFITNIIINYITIDIVISNSSSGPIPASGQHPWGGKAKGFFLLGHEEPLYIKARKDMINCKNQLFAN